MNTQRNIPLAAVALLFFAGCSASPEESPQPQASASEVSTAPTTEEPAEAPDSEPNTVNVSLDGEAEDITFTDVYCSGSSGDIQNIIGKVNNQPPLLKVSGSDHVMLKMGQEQPYTAQVSNGLTLEDESVTFDEASVSGATIDGTMECTSWD